MSIFRGDQFMLEVDIAPEAGPEEFVVVNDMNSFSKSSQRNNQTFPVFQRALPHSMAGAREQTYSVGGYINTTDPGQKALFKSEGDNKPVKIRVTFDGENGFTQLVNVGSYTYDADPEGIQEVSFEFAAAEASVVHGTEGLAL